MSSPSTLKVDPLIWCSCVVESRCLRAGSSCCRSVGLTIFFPYDSPTNRPMTARGPDRREVGEDLRSLLLRLMDRFLTASSCVLLLISDQREGRSRKEPGRVAGTSRSRSSLSAGCSLGLTVGHLCLSVSWWTNRVRPRLPHLFMLGWVLSPLSFTSKVMTSPTWR